MAKKKEVKKTGFKGWLSKDSTGTILFVAMLVLIGFIALRWFVF